MTTFDKKSLYIPFLLGITFFYLVVGLGPLDPQNLSWIFGRFDPPKDYLGWAFYRNTPWQFPLGSNPNYGMDIGSSIVYSDSVPIMAIFFKLLSPLLGNPFQYFGIWLLICFILQAYFSWKIISLFSNQTLVILFGSGLLAFAPPMLWRLNTPSGMQAGLTGHFLILAAIYLSLRPDQNKRVLYWASLLCIAVLTHFYIFAMVGALWLASLLDAFISQKKISFKQALKEFIVTSVAVLGIAWQAGYFMIRGSAGSEWGYGFFKLNLLGPINPDGWSLLLPTIPIPSTWGEGFNYLGLGAILAILSGCSLWLMMRLWNKQSELTRLMEISSSIKKYRFLFLCLLLLFISALTNHIGIGMKEFQFAIPEQVYSMLSILRSSARMYWPIHYFLVIGAIYLIIQLTPSRVAILLLGFLLAVQIADTSKGWLTVRKNIAIDMSNQIASPLLKDSIWNALASHYKKIIRIPANTQTINWIQFASLASRHAIATNSVYLARVDQHQVLEANSKLKKMIEEGNYDPNTLYILEPKWIVPALLTTGPDDVIAHIDGFTFLAPKWLKCKTCIPIPSENQIQLEQFRPSTGDRLEFTDQPKDKRSILYLGEGWSWQEGWGTWSDSEIAVLNILWPKQTPRALEIKLKAFVITDKHPMQSVDVLVNGALFTRIELSEFDNNSFVIPISQKMLTLPFLNLEFQLNNPGQPSKLISDNKDQRKLGIGLVSIRFD
jgi:hypothetical protein